MGIDIAKADFVVACRPDGTSWTATNDSEGIAATVTRLRALAPALIVFEATGGYETALVAVLVAAALPVVVGNPRQVRDFAKATGQLAKTDRLDAHLLALFAERVHPTPRRWPDAVLQQLDALMTRRRQCLPEWRRSLVIAAPFEASESSGEAARPSVPCSTWAHWSPPAATRSCAFYRRLVTAGKPKKVALIACMRKLLTILNAMMRTQTTWQQLPHPESA